MTNPNETLRKPNDGLAPTKELNTAESQVIDLAYRLGKALTQHDMASWNYLSMLDSKGITIMSHDWYSRHENEFREEKTVVLMRHGWMEAAIGSGDAVFEGNINDTRSKEIKGVSGIFPNHVVAIGAHMNEATMETARALLEKQPESGFETDYYVGRDGIVKVSLVPIEIDSREGTFPDIETLSLKRIVTDITAVDLELMEAIMQGFIVDLKKKAKEDSTEEISG